MFYVCVRTHIYSVSPNRSLSLKLLGFFRKRDLVISEESLFIVATPYLDNSLHTFFLNWECLFIVYSARGARNIENASNKYICPESHGSCLA